MIYLASLVVMLITAFFTVNPLTNQIEHTWTLSNFSQIFTSTYLRIIGRTLVMALIVTITDAVIAFPFAFFMARVASPRVRQVLFVAVLLPLWASYMARVYAWVVILSDKGVLVWTLSHLGLGSPHVAYSNTAMWIVFSYIWLPFMIIPVYGALERIPESYLQASADLGRPGLAHVPPGGAAARPARVWWPAPSSPSRSPSATSSPRSSSGGPAPASSATRSTTTSASGGTCRSPRPWPWCRS